MRIYLLVLSILFLSSFSKPLVKVTENSCAKINSTFSIKEAINQIELGTIKDSIYLACLYHQVGVEYYNNFDNINALKYYKEAINIREKINDELLWVSYHNIALTYNDLNNYNKAIFYNQLAYNIEGFKLPIDSIDILRFLSLDYAAIGDVEQALRYGKMAIKINADTLSVLGALNSLASSLVSTKDTSKARLAIFYLNKTLKLKNSRNVSNGIWTSIKVHKGFAYGLLNQNNKALEQYNIVLNSLPTEDTISRYHTLNNMGVELMDQKKHKMALEKFDRSLKLKQAYFLEEKFDFEYSANYENIADCNFKTKDYEIALENYQNAIINLTNSFRNSDVFKNPTINDSLFIYSNLDLIRVLDLKGKAAFTFYQQNKDNQYLELAQKTYQTLLDFHNQLQQEISTENSRLFQAKSLLLYLENALNVAYEKQENGADISESAFRLMEKNKATVLQQSINESQALQYANLPATIVEEESELKTAITFYKKQLNYAKVYEEPENIDRFEKLLLEKEGKYIQLIKNLESNYPNYYQLKYQQNKININDVQNYLNDDLAMLEYFVGDSSIYVLSIQKEKSKLYKIDKPLNLNEAINNFRKSITNIDLTQNSEQEAYNLFTKNGLELYNILLQKPIKDLEPNIKHLKIIPDAQLNYIPYDVLLTESANINQINYPNLSYLIKKQTLSYAYSASLLLESNQELSQFSEINSLALYAGFAPVYKPENITTTKTPQLKNNIVLRSGNIIDLPNARISVQKIADFLNGKAFLATEATKQQFIEKAHQFSIIHLATHGFLDDENPLYSNIVFCNTDDATNKFLYAADLYNLELNADLVVLSACNTGTGKLQNGEGVMSLSRAFTYAGSKSLVMSLWEVPDKATSTIIQSFFLNLKKGYTKDDALRTAKIDFITNHQDRANPLYWAGFVPSGNMAAIDFENQQSNWWLWFFGVCLFLGGITFFGIKKF